MSFLSVHFVISPIIVISRCVRDTDGMKTVKLVIIHSPLLDLSDIAKPIPPFQDCSGHLERHIRDCFYS
jgi:hypothetical protein